MNFVVKASNPSRYVDGIPNNKKTLVGSLRSPVNKIELNGRSNAVLGVRTLQNRSNGLNDFRIPKLNTVIVLNDVRSLQEDGTVV